MANFARLQNGYIDNVIVVANSDCDDLPFPESEPVGQTFIAALGIEGTWLQTSYNGNFRGCYAGIGYTYDEDSDSFVAPKVVEP
jgi:hypothetical protein